MWTFYYNIKHLCNVSSKFMCMKLFYKLGTFSFFYFLLKHNSISGNEDTLCRFFFFSLYQTLQEHSSSIHQSLSLVTLPLIGLKIVSFQNKSTEKFIYILLIINFISFLSRHPLKKKISMQHCQKKLKQAKEPKLSLDLLSSQFTSLPSFWWYLCLCGNSGCIYPSWMLTYLSLIESRL